VGDLLLLLLLLLPHLPRVNCDTANVHLGPKGFHRYVFVALTSWKPRVGRLGAYLDRFV
jgi:hypothetical protein